MDKELLISKLKEKIGNIGITDQTLDVYAENILPDITNDEMVNDAYLERQKAILKSMAGQMSFETAQRVNKFKAEWEKTHKTDPKDDKDDKQKPEPKPDAELLKRIEDLEKQLKEGDRARAKAELKSKVMDGMRAKGADDDYVLRNAMRDVELDDTKDVETLVDDCLSNYDKEYKACRGESAVPREGGHGGSGESKALDGFFDRMRAEGKFPSKN